MNNIANVWDVYIFYPIIIIALISVYLWMLITKVFISGFEQWAFFIQHFLFWLGLGFVVHFGYEFFNVTTIGSLTNLTIISILLAGSSLFYASLLFIPAALITRKVKSRKIWIYISYGASIPSLILLLAVPNLATFIIVAIGIGLGLSCNTIFYLYYNETFLNRLHPCKTVSILTPLAVIASMTSRNFYDVINLNGSSPTMSFQLLTGVALACLLVAMPFSLLMPRLKNRSFGFNASQLKVFEPFKISKLVYIMIFVFVATILKEVSQSDLYRWYIGQLVYEKSKNVSQVNQFLRLNDQLFQFSQVIISVLLASYFLKWFGFKYTFGLALFLWILFFSASAFTHYAEIFIFLQLLNGLAYGIIINLLLSLALVWNPRSKKVPVTAIFSTVNAATSFLIQYASKSVDIKQIGIFKSKNPNQWFSEKIHAFEIDQPFTVVFAICASLALAMVVLFYLKSDSIIAEYNDYTGILVYKINRVMKQELIGKFKR